MDDKDITVLITDEAMARVTALGLQAELDQMIEHAKQTAPRLVSIGVDVWHRAPFPESRRPVILRSLCRPPAVLLPFENVTWEWAGWVRRNLPQVDANIIMTATYSAPAREVA